MKIYTLTAFENIKKPDNIKLEKDFKKLCKNDIIVKSNRSKKTYKSLVNSNKSKKILKDINKKKLLTQFFKKYK